MVGRHLGVERLGGDQLDELCAAGGRVIVVALDRVCTLCQVRQWGKEAGENGAPVQQRSSRSAASEATRVSDGRLSRNIFITVAARHMLVISWSAAGH